ncbi:MAG: immunoglobulin domain-containing protein [Lachnospiraceae bacterium]|nr:immunoglobulin domain-containing protein [Lachnospiraceae bacterium]
MRAKKIVQTVFLAVFMALFVLGGKAQAAGGVAINSTNFPDSVFRNYVKENFDTNNNNSLSQAEIAAVTTVDVDNMGIASLKGIEYFTSMKKLYCEYNELTELDVSACTALEELWCRFNGMTSLNVNGCTALREIECHDNQYKTLNISGCPALEELNCHSNLLTSLNLAGCSKLKKLICGYNNIKTLDVSPCPELWDLGCNNNKIKSINFSGCQKLLDLNCQNNQLTSLNLQECPDLMILDCSGNPMTELNIAPCHYLVHVYTHGMYDEFDTRKGWIQLGHTYELILTCDQSLEISLGDVLAVTTQPEDAENALNGLAVFYVAATGSGLQFQWQYKYPDGSWKNSTNETAKTPRFEVRAEAKRNGVQYRCKVTDANGEKVYSRAAKLTIVPYISKHPEDVSAAVGNTAKFTVTATGVGLKYRWQVSKDGGETWKNVTTANTGYNEETLQIKATEGLNGFRYRCAVTDVNGIKKYSSGAKLTVKPKITSQPKTVTTVAGTTASFAVKATGTGLTYQWQYRTSSSGSWKNCTSATEGYNTATLRVSAVTGRHGYQYRCRVKNSLGNSTFSKTVTLNVLGIKTQPSSVTTTVGKTATFKVVATGIGKSYQWQFRTSSSEPWVNCSAALEGYNAATLKVVAKSYRNGYQYRCIVTDSAGNTVYSKVVKLTVK